MRVTALLAHPDDETMCAGTLAKFTDQGDPVTLVTVFSDERSDRLHRAAKILDVDLVELFESEAGFVWCQDTVRALEPIVLATEPETLIAHRLVDNNTSHVPLAQIARTIARKNNLNLWEEDVSIPGGFDPDGPLNNLLVDIDAQTVRKAETLDCYDLAYPGWREANLLRDALNGWLLHMEPGHAAEAFRIVKGVWR